MTYDSIVDHIKAEFERGDTTYIEAIEALQNICGFDSFMAESTVLEWGVTAEEKSKDGEAA